MSLFTSAPRRLCVVRLSAIGDCVNTVARSEERRVGKEC